MKNHWNATLRRKDAPSADGSPQALKAYMVELGLISSSSSGKAAAQRAPKRKRSSKDTHASQDTAADPNWEPGTEGLLLPPAGGSAAGDAELPLLKLEAPLAAELGGGQRDKSAAAAASSPGAADNALQVNSCQQGLADAADQGGFDTVAKAIGLYGGAPVAQELAGSAAYPDCNSMHSMQVPAGGKALHRLGGSSGTLGQFMVNSSSGSHLSERFYSCPDFLAHPALRQHSVISTAGDPASVSAQRDCSSLMCAPHVQLRSESAVAHGSTAGRVTGPQSAAAAHTSGCNDSWVLPELLAGTQAGERWSSQEAQHQQDQRRSSWSGVDAVGRNGLQPLSASFPGSMSLAERAGVNIKPKIVADPFLAASSAGSSRTALLHHDRMVQHTQQQHTGADLRSIPHPSASTSYPVAGTAGNPVSRVGCDEMAVVGGVSDHCLSSVLDLQESVDLQETVAFAVGEVSSYAVSMQVLLQNVSRYFETHSQV